MRTPKTTKAATEMLERFAAIEAQVEKIEADRNAAIAATNGASDALASPLVKERDEIRDKLEPWWPTAAAELTKGKRKSIELGGCIIGSRAGRTVLHIARDEAMIVAKMEKLAWAKALLKVTTKLDKAAILKATDGADSKKLKTLGLSRIVARETFFVERAEQAGTQESVA